MRINFKSRSLFAFNTVTVMRSGSSDLDLNFTSQQSPREKLGMKQVLSESLVFLSKFAFFSFFSLINRLV